MKRRTLFTYNVSLYNSLTEHELPLLNLSIFCVFNQYGQNNNNKHMN